MYPQPEVPTAFESLRSIAWAAAHFLKEFVGDTPWVHLDIAGPSNVNKEKGYLSKGGTGFGVRTLVEFIRRRTAELNAAAADETLAPEEE